MPAIGRGLSVAGREAARFAPVIDLIAPGSPAALLTTLISNLTIRAEEKFPQQGSGKDKAAWVTVEALRTMETLTSLNYDSPAGRALIQKLIDIDVAIKNAIAQAVTPLQAQYDEVRTALDAYVASVKEPAKEDTAA